MYRIAVLLLFMYLLMLHTQACARAMASKIITDLGEHKTTS